MKKIISIIIISFFIFSWRIFAYENCNEKDYSNLYDWVFYLQNNKDLWVVFIAQKNNKFFIVKNQKRTGKKYLADNVFLPIDLLQITPDSKISYIEKKDSKKFLVKDFKIISEKFDDILNIKFSSDWKSFVFIAKKDSKYFIVKNNKIISKKFDKISSIKYLDYFKWKIYYIFSENNKDYLVEKHNLKKTSSWYDKILDISISPDKDIIYFSVLKNGKYFVVWKNEKIITKKYDKNDYYIWSIWYSPAWDLIYSVRKDSKWYIVKNEKIITRKYDWIGWKYSPAWDLVVVAKKDSKWFLIKDNKRFSSKYDSITYLSFSKKWEDIAFIWENYWYKYVVKNHKIVSDKYEIFKNLWENITSSIKDLSFLENGDIVFLIENYNKVKDWKNWSKVIKKISCWDNIDNTTPTIITNNARLKKNYILRKQDLIKSKYKNYVYDIEKLINNSKEEKLSSLFYKVEDVQKSLKYNTSYKYKDLKAFVNFLEAALRLKLSEF